MGDNSEPSTKREDQSKNAKPNSPNIIKAWDWVRSIFRSHQVRAGLIAGFIVAIATVLWQSWLDDMRAADANRQGNVRFIRDKSSSEHLDRPFASLDVKGQKLVGLQLHGADFMQANLTSTNLSATNLSDANLTAARLNDARLTNTNLSGADLGGTYLAGADLSFSDLSNASLWKSSLTFFGWHGVNLAGTDLRGADFRHTHFLWSVELRDHDLIELLVDAANGDLLAQINTELRTGALPDEMRELIQPDFASLPDFPDHATACFDSTTKWPQNFEPPPMWPDACLIHDAIEDLPKEN